MMQHIQFAFMPVMQGKFDIIKVMNIIDYINQSKEKKIG